jgi:hypothetical protein
MLGRRHAGMLGIAILSDMIGVALTLMGSTSVLDTDTMLNSILQDAPCTAALVTRVLLGFCNSTCLISDTTPVNCLI